MALRLSGQTSKFGVVFFVSKSLLGIERQKKLKKFAILTQKPRSHASQEYWYIERGLFKKEIGSIRGWPRKDEMRITYTADTDSLKFWLML